MLASLLRGEIEQRLSPGAGRMATLLALRREALRAAFPDLAARRASLRKILLGPAAEAAGAGDDATALALIDAALTGASEPSEVVIIERPGAPDLISLRALRLVGAADIVAFDPADEALVAAHARRDVVKTGLGDAGALAAAALAGQLVAAIASDPASLAEAVSAAGARVRPVRSAS